MVNRRTELSGKKSTKKRPQADSLKLGHVPIQSITPSPENDKLYRPVNAADPEVVEMADSIRRCGILEPIVVTIDGFILSGHRRHAAASVAGLKEVPVRIVPVRRADDLDAFVVLLREHNRQRDKTADEKLREEIASINKDEAYSELLRYRQKQSRIVVPQMEIDGYQPRAKISAAKAPFLEAIEAVIYERAEYWPLSDRQIHYALLNAPPLKHAGKPNSIYDNTLQSYKSLVDLLARARLDDTIPWESIGDETRPVTLWDVVPNSRQYVRNQIKHFLRDYHRNLMQSQPNHLEIVGEKNTVAAIIEQVASEYGITVTTGRGYCSLPPRYEMAERFKDSGKECLVLLIVSDFDPDGEEIAKTFARSMRDDFDIEKIHPIKVALTGKQVDRHNLPPVMTAKPSSSRYQKFVDSHGQNVYELEALPPATLQNILREAIESVIDKDAFDKEIESEKQDAAFLAARRKQAIAAIGNLE